MRGRLPTCQKCAAFGFIMQLYRQNWLQKLEKQLPHASWHGVSLGQKIIFSMCCLTLKQLSPLLGKSLKRKRSRWRLILMTRYLMSMSRAVAPSILIHCSMTYQASFRVLQIAYLSISGPPNHLQLLRVSLLHQSNEN